MALSFGAITSQSSSAACMVGATADASAQRVRSRETTISRPSRPPLREASFTTASFPSPRLRGEGGERNEPGEEQGTTERAPHPTHLRCASAGRPLPASGEKRRKNPRQASRLALAGVEVLLQPAPAINVIVLQRLKLGRVLGHALA